VKSCKKYISTIVMLCFILTPLFSYAQRSRTEPEQEDSFEAQRAGIADAKSDASFPLWYSMGCFFSIFGVGAANLIVPKASHERLMGKSREYVWAYSESYKSTRRALQSRYAVFGCVTSGVMVTIAAGFVIAQSDEGCSPNWSCGTDACDENWDQCTENWSSCTEDWSNCTEKWSNCTENWSSCGSSEDGCSNIEGCGGCENGCSNTDGCGSSDNGCSNIEGCGDSEDGCLNTDGCGSSDGGCSNTEGCGSSDGCGSSSSCGD
jgi:hypothetical protein